MVFVSFSYSVLWNSSVEKTLKFSILGGLSSESLTFPMASEKTPFSDVFNVSSSCQSVRIVAPFGLSCDSIDMYPRNPGVCRVEVLSILSSSENPSSRFPLLNCHIDILPKTNWSSSEIPNGIRSFIA